MSLQVWSVVLLSKRSNNNTLRLTEQKIQEFLSQLSPKFANYSFADNFNGLKNNFIQQFKFSTPPALNLSRTT